jgi:hypothetical protein
LCEAGGEEAGGEEEFGEAHGGVMVLFELVRAAMNDEPVSRMGNSCDPVEAFLVDQGEELE